MPNKTVTDAEIAEILAMPDSVVSHTTKILARALQEAHVERDRHWSDLVVERQIVENIAILGLGLPENWRQIGGNLLSEGVRDLRAQLNAIRAAINPDDSLTEPQEFILAAEEGAEAVKRLSDCVEQLQEERKYNAQTSALLQEQYDLVKDLRAQLASAWQKIEDKDLALRYARNRVSNLEQQVARLREVLTLAKQLPSSSDYYCLGCGAYLADEPCRLNCKVHDTREAIDAALAECEPKTSITR